MPALSSSSGFVSSLIGQNNMNFANTTPPLNMTNGTSGVLDVICAWPVSGQYGPGTRILYYVLVAACVLGRGSAWLKSACLAAALLLPAVAALHGIVLAVLHVDGAVDMDVYGAFQLCAIGVLAGPATVRLSQTYFNAPGRNLIFLWTGMILAGLLSLTVEFFRATPVRCPAGDFFWGGDACNLTCSVDLGPTSPLRGGSQNNIYVIEAPDMLTFGTATLLAAACCIPAILSLVSMWNMILKIKWKKRFGDGDESADLHAPISGTNDATPAKMLKVNDRIRFYLSMVEIPVFGAAILAILILGERNFFSYRVAYMTEPIASVGQWAPIVGTGLATLGSLYALLATDAETTLPAGGSDAGTHHCTCSHHHLNMDNDSVKLPSHGHNEGRDETGGMESDQDGMEMTRQDTYQTYQSDALRRTSRQLSHATTRGTFGELHRLHRAGTEGTASATADAGSRRKVAGALEWIGHKLGTPAPDAFDDSAFLTGPAADFPTVPGEEERNPELHKIRASYNPRRDSEGNATPLRRQRSRTGSFSGSVVSALGITALSEAELPNTDTAAGPVESLADRPRMRRHTLEVPKPAYHSPVPRRALSSASTPDSLAVDETTQHPSSPSIRVFPEPSS